MGLNEVIGEYENDISGVCDNYTGKRDKKLLLHPCNATGKDSQLKLETFLLFSFFSFSEEYIDFRERVCPKLLGNVLSLYVWHSSNS